MLGKIQTEIKVIGMFLLFCAIGCVLVILDKFLSIYPEKYPDYIVEYLAMYNSNKTNEMWIFWIVLVVSFVLLIIIGKKTNLLMRLTECEKEFNDTLYIGAFLICSFVGSVMLLGNNVSPLLTGCVFCYIYGLLRKKNEKNVIVCYLIQYLFVISIYKLISICFCANISNCVFVIMAILLMILFEEIKCNEKLLHIQMCFFPFLLLCYLTSEYHISGEILSVKQSLLYRLVIWGIIVLGVVFQIVINFIYDKKTNRTGRVINYITCFFAAAFFQCETVTRVVSDFHHPGEVLASYIQVADYGMKLYKNYYPVSGLFSFFYGFISKILGFDYAGFYAMASLVGLFLTMLTIFLLSYIIDSEKLFFFVCTFSLYTMPMICRTQFVVVFALVLLLLGKKQVSKITFVICWEVLCILMGLYYPIYGVAFFVGTIPLGINYILKKDSPLFLGGKNDVEKWMKNGLFICINLIVLMASIPFFLAMAKHILLYSSQTRLADGMVVLGATVYEKFAPYLMIFTTSREVIFWGLWFVVPTMILIGVGVFLCVDTKEKIDERYVLFFLIMISIISFSYSTVRATNGMLERTEFILFPLVPLFVLIFAKDCKFKYSFLGICCAISLLYGGNSTRYVEQSLKSYYEVEGDYCYISKDFDLSPDSFMTIVDFDRVSNEKRIVDEIEAKIDEDVYVWGMDLGDIYINNFHSIAQPSMMAIKSVETTQESIDVLKATKNCIVFKNIYSVWEYPLFKYLNLTDEFVYLDQYDCFVNVDLAQKIVVECDEEVSCAWKNEYLGYVANSLGDSLVAYGNDWIQGAATNVNEAEIVSETQNSTTYRISFDQEFYGSEGDFLFFQLGTMDQNSDLIRKNIDTITTMEKQEEVIALSVIWMDRYGEKHYERMSGRDGYFLIPLGVDGKWLNEKHNELLIVVDKKEESANLEFQGVKLFVMSKNVE